MRIIEVTRPLSPDALLYPGDTRPEFSKVDNGAYVITSLTLSSHTGTHVDAPAHYLRDDRTVDKIPPGHLIGKCHVIDLRNVRGEISPADLAEIPPGTKRVLIRTSFSGKTAFSEDYPSIGPEAAATLMKTGVICIGIDSPSVERFHCDGGVHRQLLGAGIALVELLDLSDVVAGNYRMVALPLRLSGLDGSPARVLLFEGDWPDD